MKKTFLIVLLLSGIVGCNAQDGKSKKVTSFDAKPVQNNPQVNWKVNKQFDKDGNLIRYDSTYSWSYTGKSGAKHQVEVDSVMNAFKTQFDSEFPSFFRESFGTPVWWDSLFYNDFISPDYFMSRWENNYFDIEKMMHRPGLPEKFFFE